MPARVSGLESRVSGLGFRVLGFAAEGSVCRIFILVMPATD